MKKVLTISFLAICGWAWSQDVELVIQQGHYEPITQLIFSADDKYLISAGEDQHIKIWEIRSGMEYRSLRGHEAAITALALSRDGSTLLSGDEDGNLIFWDWKAGKELSRQEEIHQSIDAISFSSDGSKYATGSYKEFRTWDYSTKSMILDVHGRRKSYDEIPIHHSVSTIHFVDKDASILTGSADNFVRKWNSVTGELIWAVDLKGTDSSPSEISIVDNKSFYHSGSTDDIVQRDIASGNMITQFEGLGSGSPCQVKFTADSKFQFSVCGTRLQSMETGSEIFQVDDGYYNNKAVAFSNNGKLLALSGENSREEPSIRIFNTRTGGRLKILKGFPGRIMDLSFSTDNSLLISGNYQRPARIWQLSNVFGFKNYFKSENDRGDIFQSVALHEASNTLLVGEQHRLHFYDRITGEKLKTVFKGGQEPKHVKLAPNGNIIMNSNTVRVWDNEGELLSELKGPRVRTKSVATTVDGSVIMAGGYKEIKRWSSDNFEELEPFETTQYIEQIAINPDGRSFAAFETTDLYIRDINTGEVLSMHEDLWESNPVYSQDGSKFATSQRDKIIIRDSDSFEILFQLEGHSDNINALAFSSDGKILASGSDDTTIKLWDLAQGNLMATLIALNEEDFIITTPDLYYMSSQGGAKGVAFRVDEKLFPFEQFDLQYNRPDIVLDRIGYSNQSMIDALRRAYEKRLQRLGFDESRFEADFHLPEIRIVNNDLPSNSQERDLFLQITGTDEKYPLDRLQLTVNGVPIFGLKGSAIKKKQKHNQAVILSLSDGLNKIEVSVFNDRGVESLRESFEIIYDGPPASSKLHLVTIGVSEYQNDQMNLDYAAKDAQDIASLFSGADHLNEESIVYSLNNEQATKVEIQKLKERLKKSGVNDRVVVFVAGHGLLDHKLDYYLAMHDIDFNDPGSKGLAYDELEDLVDGIGARKKMILIDACHSGELDKEEIEVEEAEVEQGSVTFRSVNNKKLQYKSPVGLENSFQLSKQLFSDLRRRSGATVIASAGGAEYALEGSDWNNGVFTFSLLSGLRSGDADLDNDGKVMLSELQKYLQQNVSELTGGKQKPASRIENINFDFRVW